MKDSELVSVHLLEGCTPTFEAAAITVTDGTHPCFPFFPPDFEEMERTVKIRIVRIFFLEPSGMAKGYAPANSGTRCWGEGGRIVC